jgi:uncharacterized membrane protein
MPELLPGAGLAPPHLHPRVVPWQHAFAWYEEGMRLFKHAPLTWIGLSVLTLATELVFAALPDAGTLVSEIVTPLVGCGLAYAAAVADRRGSPSLALALAAFRAGGGAIAAIVAAALLTFAIQALAAWWIAGANLLAPATASTELSVAAALGIQMTGIIAALPITFVPFHVLFERVRPAAAFAASLNAFAENALPLLVYAAASLILLAFAAVTLGFGLVLALPLWTASAYAAWKDVFGVREAPEL